MTDLDRKRMQIELAERRVQIMKSELRIAEIEHEKANLQATIARVEGVIGDLVRDLGAAEGDGDGSTAG